MYETINKYVGIKWLKQGSDPLKGVDCWGLLRHVFKEEKNILIPGDYHSLLNPNFKEITKLDRCEIVKSFKQGISNGHWLKEDAPEDFYAVAMSSSIKIHHVGVWIGGGCLHAVENVGVVYNDLKQLHRNGYTKVEYYRCLMLQ